MATQAKTVRLSAVETVQVERTDRTVRLCFEVGGVPVLSKHITAEAARHLGDALGFASNDIGRAA